MAILSDEGIEGMKEGFLTFDLILWLNEANYTYAL